MALAAEESRAASFYLDEVVDCVTGEARADGLTVEEARGHLAGNEVLLRQFNAMMARRQAPRPEPNAGQQRSR